MDANPGSGISPPSELESLRRRCADLERALAEAQSASRLRDQLARLLAHLPLDGFFLLDGDGRIRALSENGARSLGGTPGDLTGKCIFDLMPQEMAAVRRKGVLEVLRSGKPVYFQDRRDDRSLRNSLFPVAGPDGRAELVAVFVRDVTEERRSEAALAESRGMLQLVLDTIPARVFWKDRDSRYLGCNRLFARDAGRESPEDVVGLDDFAMAWRKEAEGFRADDRSVIESGQPKLDYEEPETIPGGKTLWVRTSKLPLRDLQGEIIGVLGTYEDITERKRLEEQFRQAQKMESIGRLAGGIAHDLNNMMTPILGHAEMLRNELAPEDGRRNRAIGIMAAAERAAALTRRLLAFSRKQALDVRTLDLNQAVLGFGGMVGRALREDIRMETRLAPGLGSIRADPSQIEQILMNLAVNAQDAMPKGGTLMLETAEVTLDGAYCAAHHPAKPGEYVMLAVSDTGIGMDRETQARLFEPFFTTKEVGKGTGLGLATVYGIVKQHSGYVWAYSEPGKGTTFKIYFPRFSEAAPTPPATPSGQAARAGTETILLVEDDAGVRDMVRGLLSAQGYKVLDASGGAECLRLVEGYQGEIHLLLTDVVMPDMNGSELWDRLRERRTGLKALFMSGYTESGILHQGILREGIAFIGKPFAVEALLGKIRQVLEG